MHHDEKRLFKGIVNGGGRIYYLLKAFVNQLRDFQRIIDRAADGHGPGAQPAAGQGVVKEIIGKHGMKVEDGITVKTDLLDLLLVARSD
jgi:hypothetical protein